MIIGHKYITEAVDFMVGEHSSCVEGVPVRDLGASGSETVGMSNDKKGEKPFHRKPKGS